MHILAYAHGRTADGFISLAALSGSCPAKSIDIQASLHHDANMRTTIDLPEELHRILTSLATHRRSSLSQTAAELIRRGLVAPMRDPQERGCTINSTTGLPVVHSSRPITPEDVRALEDES